ncbi:MAG: FABP family protein [Caulobacterales bacterium]
MSEFPADIFTEPANVDPDTLANLGPLTRMAGVWEGRKGVDVNPKAAGPERKDFVEHIELQPIDPQTNGPQLFYGLRYHTHIIQPEDTGTYHDQIGYWLWEPASGLILQTLTIPRGQIAMASGNASADATSFTLTATRGEMGSGILSTAFLEHAFRTESYRIEVTLHPGGEWSYYEDTVLLVRGQSEPFHHEDRNTLTRIAAPTPNPLALGQTRA